MSPRIVVLTTYGTLQTEYAAAANAAAAKEKKDKEEREKSTTELTKALALVTAGAGIANVGRAQNLNAI